VGQAIKPATMPTDGRLTSSRALSDDARRRAFAVAAAVLVAAIIGISLLPDNGSRKDEQLQEEARHPTIVGKPTGRKGPITDAPSPASPSRPARTTVPTRRATRTPMRHLSDGDRRAVVARARAFLRAYLAYEVGATQPWVRRGLQRSATRRFARELVRNPPRFSRTSRLARGQVTSLELGDDPDAPFVGVAAVISRAGHLSPLTMQLDRASDGWHVSRLR
jgi:hypothetical protein